MSDKFWINHPEDVNRARLKPYQLKLAKDFGFLVPETIITNDPALAREFCGVGQSIFKPVTVPHLDYGEKVYTVETTLITENLMDSLYLIKSQPSIFQRFIKKSYEMRVTYIGGQYFVAKQEQLSSDMVVDWRLMQGTKDCVYTPFYVTENLQGKIGDMMNKYNLGFAAMDFAVDSIGNVYFLEINPNGQWLGYTDEIGMPAAAAVAYCLANKTRQAKI